MDAGFRDLKGFEASTRRLVRLGFFGRACIHLAQVSVADAVFTPSPDAVARARSAVAGFDQQVAVGSGIAVDEQGCMVDEAVVRAARQVVHLADRLAVAGA